MCSPVERLDINEGSSAGGGETGSTQPPPPEPELELLTQPPTHETMDDVEATQTSTQDEPPHSDKSGTEREFKTPAQSTSKSEGRGRPTTTGKSTTKSKSKSRSISRARRAEKPAEPVRPSRARVHRPERGQKLTLIFIKAETLIYLMYKTVCSNLQA